VATYFDHGGLPQTIQLL